MTPFMDADFLLKTQTAKTLYHDHAEKMPIIDYHCHINPQEICEDKRYQSITEVWLGGDHYKRRVMRACGVPEYYVTGPADLERLGKMVENISYNNTLHYFRFDELI